MSFILDALKKSELERQRQSLPGLVEVGGTRTRGRLPAWAIALGALLGVNLLVLVFLLSRNSASTARAPAETRPAVAPQTTASTGADAGAAASAAQPAAGVPVVPSAVPGFSPMDGSSDYAPEIPVANAGGSGTVAASSDLAASGSEPRGAGPVHPARPTHRQEPVLSQTQPQDYRPVDEEVLPTINEVSLTGADALPELHLDVHVFATRAAERFVYINMRKYHEGATLQEGPVIERIRRDGVVLRWQNLRFLLPRR
jgi:general secretion pathway protein B